MEFAQEQLVVFTVMLSSFATLAFIFAVRAIYMAWKAVEKQQRFDWILATAFALLVLVFVVFQLYRIVIRF